MAAKQVKSKQRVADHGEVFTAEREVNAMLDLVKNETERIESRFLEPACGDGNFLAEILRRKLAVVQKKYGGARMRHDFEMWSVIAVMNIYGVELLPDNAATCRERLFKIWDEAYTANCKADAIDECRDAVRYILERSILCGEALSLKQENGEPIIFAEWSFVTGTNVYAVTDIRSAMGKEWERDKRYRVRGFWVAEAKTMCFDLPEGVQEDYRTVGADGESEE